MLFYQNVIQGYTQRGNANKLIWQKKEDWIGKIAPRKIRGFSFSLRVHIVCLRVLPLTDDKDPLRCCQGPQYRALPLLIILDRYLQTPRRPYVDDKNTSTDNILAECDISWKRLRKCHREFNSFERIDLNPPLSSYPPPRPLPICLSKATTPSPLLLGCDNNRRDLNFYVGPRTDTR